MAVKDVKRYYYAMLNQYLEMKADLTDFEQAFADGFITEDQIEEEIGRLIDLFDYVYSVFGLKYHIELSTRPEDKYIGEIETWKESKTACKSSPTLVAAI